MKDVKDDVKNKEKFGQVIMDIIIDIKLIRVCYHFPGELG